MKSLFIAALLALPAIVGATPLDLSPKIPNLYTDGLTRLQQPNLTLPQRAAFSIMESMQQLTEAYVQANGCPAKPGLSAKLEVYSDQNGTGDATLTTPGATLEMETRQVAFDSFRGSVQGVRLLSGNIASTRFTNLVGLYRFNKPGSIMEGDAVFSVLNPTTGTTPDIFTGRVIKDFYKVLVRTKEEPRFAVIDWGLQVLNKKGYPVAKWWQRSFSFQDNGIEGVTRFEKWRIAGGVPCVIKLITKGQDNAEEFDESGTLSVVQAPLPR
jgi:hypothetical protein